MVRGPDGRGGGRSRRAASPGPNGSPGALRHRAPVRSARRRGAPAARFLLRPLAHAGGRPRPGGVRLCPAPWRGHPPRPGQPGPAGPAGWAASRGAGAPGHRGCRGQPRPVEFPTSGPKQFRRDGPQPGGGPSGDWRRGAGGRLDAGCLASGRLRAVAGPRCVARRGRVRAARTCRQGAGQPGAEGPSPPVRVEARPTCCSGWEACRWMPPGCVTASAAARTAGMCSPGGPCW